jgi:hypothetical protein
MNFRRPSGRGNAIKRYGNPVTHKVFSPIYIKYHPLFLATLSKKSRTLMKCNNLHVHNLKAILAQTD